jgi:hypothetical protein
MNCLYSTCRLTLIPDGWLYGSNPRWQRADQYPEVGLSSGNQALTRCAFLVTYVARLPTTGLLACNNLRLARYSGAITEYFSMSEVQLHHHGSGPSSFENVPVGPFASRSARRTGSRAPSSTVRVPV